MPVFQLDNAASIIFNEAPVNSNQVTTRLLLVPSITKSVDKATAYIGDILTYTITIVNSSVTDIVDLPLTDVLPEGCSYVADSFTDDSESATPTLTGNTLTYTISDIAESETKILTFQVTVTG